MKFRTWEGIRHDWAVINFSTIGSMLVPLPPKTLPPFFRMINHAEWIKIRNLVLEDWRTASFEELDRKVLDLKLLENTTGCEFGDVFIPYLDRLEYLKWSESFSEAWEDLESQVNQILESACVPKSLTPIGKRVMPPSLVDTLKMMLAEAEKMERNDHDEE